MFSIRLVKTTMVASLALFALLTAYNNVADYGSNYAFVRHTLTMDTPFRDNALKGRAITSPVAWTLAYWVIILTEAVVGVGLGFLLWFTGFMVLGGEWFLMWQSKQFNGQEAAFRFYMTLLAVGIFVSLPDGDSTSA